MEIFKQNKKLEKNENLWLCFPDFVFQVGDMTLFDELLLISSSFAAHY